jgi:hypothetical protein
MDNVIVNVNRVLETLRTNREAHVTEFKEALDLYKQIIIKELSTKLKAAKRGDEVDFRFSNRPTSFADQFDNAIAKLEWTTSTEVSLTDSEFRQYVLGQWSWKNAFETSVGVIKSYRG